MEWFMLGIICGVVLGAILPRRKSRKSGDVTVITADTIVTPPDLKPQKSQNVKREDEHQIKELSIPVEVKPNLYALQVDHVSMKHHLVYKEGKKWLEYITVKCEVRYDLSGRKEGIRRFVFTSYDEKGAVLDIAGDSKGYRLTQAGYESVDVCFNDAHRIPSGISISIREGKAD